MTGHIRKRGSSYEIRYPVRDAATGERRVITRTVKGDRKTAEKELRRLLHALDEGLHVDPSNLTVGQWLQTWLETARVEKSRRTHDTYSSVVRYHLAPSIGHIALARLLPIDVQSLYNRLGGDNGRARGKAGPLSLSSRKQVHKVLSQALARAVEQQLLSRNVCDVFRRRMPKAQHKSTKVLDGAQIRALLEAMRGTELFAPVLLAISTGARRGEILALTWDDIDLDAGELMITASLEQIRRVLRLKPTKSGKARGIALPAFAVEELRALKREQAEAFLALGVRQIGATLVCARADASAFKPDAVSGAFRYAIRRLDLPPVRFHDLRHSHATELLRGGIHPKIAQARLGHSSIAVTMDIYSHLTAEMQRGAAEFLDRALAGSNPGSKIAKDPHKS